MTPIEMIAEWEKGCTCAGPAYDSMMNNPQGTTQPEECFECTSGLISAIKEYYLKEKLMNKYQWFDDGCTCKAVVDYDIIKIKAVSGYSPDVNTLLKLKDTGNGFIAKIPSYSRIDQDNYICFDYAEADYLYKALQVWFAENS